jgi:hypothetical protein
VIVARPISNEGPPQRRERAAIRIDEPRRPPFLRKEGVSLERQESTTVKEPIRFSTAFCVWLRIGGPLL